MIGNKSKKKTCEHCGSQNLKCKQTKYPVKFDEKTIEVQRVSVRECLDCHAMKPTQAGEEKISRCLMTFMSMFDR
jgi:YgiT-type zinc finger domain-containing protein